jgi:hypothetical protein
MLLKLNVNGGVKMSEDILWSGFSGVGKEIVRTTDGRIYHGGELIHTPSRTGSKVISGAERIETVEESIQSWYERRND